MQEDYYQNTFYPLQNRVLKIIGKLDVEFYLTGGTALSRIYLHHRFSDDLDFFVNGVSDFKHQVSMVLKGLSVSGMKFETTVADEGFARVFIYENKDSLKLDFVNDVPFHSGTFSETSLFPRTDNILNILSNKVTALSRCAPKDVVDIIHICGIVPFRWEDIFSDASEKDTWSNPINAAEILEQFPVEKTEEIIWIGDMQSQDWFSSRIWRIIRDMLEGCENSLCLKG
jgi:hypothetical protein